jgi:hypothetical protein
MKKTRYFIFLAILATNLFSFAAQSQEPTTQEPIVGRIELTVKEGKPTLPEEILYGGTTHKKTAPPKHLSAKEQEKIMANREAIFNNFGGEWHGLVRITSMRVFPAYHKSRFWQRFITEIEHFFHVKQIGKMGVTFKQKEDNITHLMNSDIKFLRGAQITLSEHAGESMVEGAWSIPSTIKNQARRLSNKRVEQSRYDHVLFVDQYEHPIAEGYTELTGDYELIKPNTMQVKVMNVDYNEEGNPLWECIIEGKVIRTRKFSKHSDHH